MLHELKSQRYFVERYGATINATWDKNWPQLINKYLPGHWWASSCCWSPKPGLASWWTWARPACPRSKFSRNTWSQKKQEFRNWSRNPRLTFLSQNAGLPGACQPSRWAVTLVDVHALGAALGPGKRATATSPSILPVVSGYHTGVVTWRKRLFPSPFNTLILRPWVWTSWVA